MKRLDREHGFNFPQNYQDEQEVQNNGEMFLSLSACNQNTKFKGKIIIFEKDAKRLNL